MIQKKVIQVHLLKKIIKVLKYSYINNIINFNNVFKIKIIYFSNFTNYYIINYFYYNKRLSLLYTLLNE